MSYMRNNNNGRRHNNNFNNNRSRHNNHHQGNQGNNQQRRFVNRINQVFDSNGPEGRIRGTAQQIAEKYATLARDSSHSRDQVLQQNYWQHAEHYQRLLTEIMEENAVNEREREALRAQQQQAQPLDALEPLEGVPADHVAIDGAADEGIAPPPAERREQRPQQRPRHENNRNDRRDRDDRGHFRQENIAPEDNELPSFLQLPAPREPAAEASEGDAPSRTVRARTPRRAPTSEPAAE